MSDCLEPLHRRGSGPGVEDCRGGSRCARGIAGGGRPAQTPAVVAGELGQAFDAYMQEQADAGFAGSMIVVKIRRRPV